MDGAQTVVGSDYLLVWRGFCRGDQIWRAPVKIMVAGATRKAECQEFAA